MSDGAAADFPSGPLDYYRKKASFDWKKLRIYIETEEIAKFKDEYFEEIRSLHAFKEDFGSLTLDEQRRKSAKRLFQLFEMDKMKRENMMANLRNVGAIGKSLMPIYTAESIMFTVASALFFNTIMAIGTEKHLELIEDVDSGKIVVAFCMTEIGHGSNTKSIQCKAIYNKLTKKFVMHTDNFQAAKCWAGNLGQKATYAIVFAQLIIEEKCYGLHAFLVKLRDPQTLLPYPGVIVGDMGEKIGLNGIDNGFLMFDHYEIPKESLLNKLADVTDDGVYTGGSKDSKKIRGSSLGALSGGRIGVLTSSESMGMKALTIAIRYAAVRKQFGPDDNSSEEVSIIEYQSHQYRLFPHLATIYVYKFFSDYFLEAFFQFGLDQAFGNNKELLLDTGVEIHALSCVAKSLYTWTMRDCIQECREACGGHGYLKAAGLGDVRNDNDANLTLEGDNYVIIQQTNNYLLKFWPQILLKQKISSPLKSVDFLTNGLNILETEKFQIKTIEELIIPENIIKIYQWLVVYLLKISHQKLEKDMQKTKNLFWAKNNNLIFYSNNLSIAYCQQFLMQRMLIAIENAPEPNIRLVLQKLFALYGLWSLRTYLPYLYQGGYASGALATELVHEAILQLCSQLKDEAVALIDAIALPDHILNSVLGYSDGEVYKHLQAAMFQQPNAFSRPSWWQEIVHWKEALKNKL